MLTVRPNAALLLSLVVILSPVVAQQSSTNVQPAALIQQSLTASAPTGIASDITLTGSARRIGGSTDETGTVTLKVLSSGAARLEFNYPSGSFVEFRTFVSSTPTGAWSGPDGVVHPIADHNLVNDWGWFPVFTLANSANSQIFAVAFMGTETRNDQSVLHLKSLQQFPSLTGSDADLMKHLSQTDIFLDVTTLLPTTLSYNIHPDKNALLDVPVDLRYSSYRGVNGSQVPFRIQKFVNNTLVLDLQFQNAALNTGITAAQIGA